MERLLDINQLERVTCAVVETARDTADSRQTFCFSPNLEEGGDFGELFLVES